MRKRSIAVLAWVVFSGFVAAQEAASKPAYGGPRPFPYPYRSPATPVAELKERRARLAAEIRNGAAILVSDETPSLYTGGRYRPGNNLYYFTGVESDFCALVIEAKEGKLVRETLFLPAYDAGYELWNGVRTTADDAARAATGVQDLVPLGASSFGETYGAFEKEFERLVRSGTTLWLEGGAAPGRARTKTLRLAAPTRADLLREHAERLLEEPSKGAASGSGRAEGTQAEDEKSESGSGRGTTARRRIRSAASAAAKLRAVKSDHEIALIREAVRVTGEAYARAIPEVRPGMWEFEFDALMQGAFIAAGCSGLPYYPIAASGPNSCILHYNLSRRRMEDGDLLLSDIAAEWGWYAADITRTVPVNGKFTPRQRQVYEAVLAGQTAAAVILRPGVDWATLDRECRAAMRAAGLKDSEMHPHGLGHPVGLDVHDVGDQTLKAGMLVTIEPGSYLKREGFGVRIEDVYLVTEHGSECLSRGIPRGPDEIEAWVGSAHRKK
jgi:Xaa-Pro aminopeptidase